MYLSDLMLLELSVDTADGELITRYSQVGKYRVPAGREKERKRGREEERKARLIGGKCCDFVIN